MSPLAALLCTPKGSSTWFILAWDQRHICAVNAQESEDIAIRYLEKHIDSLGLDIYAIHLSQHVHLSSSDFGSQLASSMA